MANEVPSTEQGKPIAIPLADLRKRYKNPKPPDMAKELKRLAREVQL